MFLRKDTVEEGSCRVCMMEIGDERGVVVVGAVVVVIKDDGVGYDLSPVDVNMSAVGGWVTFDVKVGIEVVNPQDGVGMDEISNGISPEVSMADCWE